MGKKRELNGVLERLTDFAESKGGVSKVYGAIGKQPSTYWNMVARDLKPSTDTLIQIGEAFPDFDINWVLLGRKSSDMIDRYKVQIDTLKDMYEKAVLEKNLVGKYKGVSFHPLADRPGFSELLGKSIVSGVIFGKRQN